MVQKKVAPKKPAPRKTTTKKKPKGKRNPMPVLLVLLILAIVGTVGPIVGFDFYINKSAMALVEQEKRGELSKRYGYVWAEINLNKQMEKFGGNEKSDEEEPAGTNVQYPSLEAVTILNSMNALSNKILILDRNGIELGKIQTTQHLLAIDEFPELLKKSLILTEDKNFYSRKNAYESTALIRATATAVIRSIKEKRKVSPRGTSTIHQQVARFLLSQFNEKGQIYIEKTVNRKLKELKLSQALKIHFSDDEILSMYMNHCVSAGKGMVGFYDISMGLFGKEPRDLTDAQQLYLSRLVKWNANKPEKIVPQVKISLPRIAKELKWDDAKVSEITGELESLEFVTRPPVIESKFAHLLDLANEQWLRACELNGISGDELRDLDFSRPESMIRRKGNLTIQMTIDIRLQRMLEESVNNRGYGNDTTITTDIRIGSYGEDVRYSGEMPEDTLRYVEVLTSDSIVSDPDGEETKLVAGDTLISNIRYKKTGNKTARRSVYLYSRGVTKVTGQYFSYLMLDSPTGEILAYYSRDKLGSRMNSLIRNRVPNGSALSKPMVYALAYDAGIYQPNTMVDDGIEIDESQPWNRQFLVAGSDTVGMRYLNVFDEKGYEVRNHHRKFEGSDYAFNHLARSNNIITVETMFRLNEAEKKDDSNPAADEYREALMDRIGATDYIRRDAARITGPRIWSELAGVVYGDSEGDQEGRAFVSDDNYSYALGTLELSILEQAHLFNGFYDNKIVQSPASHPSLVIKQVLLAGEPFPMNDSVAVVQPFADISNINPVKLALFKRLTSTETEGMQRFDLATDPDHPELMPLRSPLVNYAKSGTTDDIIRPYNADASTKKKTNYGLWHGTFRIKLPGSEIAGTKRYAASYDDQESQIRDITVACVGEGNRANTGAPDGKTLHRFLTTTLMNRYGVAGTGTGFYRTYEESIGAGVSETVDSTETSLVEDVTDFIGGLGLLPNASELKFEALRGGILLEKRSEKKLLALANQLDEEQAVLQSYIEELSRGLEKAKVEAVLKKIEQMEIANSKVADELTKSVASLRSSLQEL